MRQSGRVSAGADGVKGISSAVAVAKVEQTADQPIEQRASAAAIAVADEVDVTATNVRAGEDGVVGVSARSPLPKAAAARWIWRLWLSGIRVSMWISGRFRSTSTPSRWRWLMR